MLNFHQDNNTKKDLNSLGVARQPCIIKELSMIILFCHILTLLRRVHQFEVFRHYSQTNNLNQSVVSIVYTKYLFFPTMIE